MHITSFKDKTALECYILSEAPMSCGLCGARTDFDVKDDGSQVHQCLNSDCGYRFIAVEDG